MLSCDNVHMAAEDYMFMRPHHGNKKHPTRHDETELVTFCNRKCDGWILEPEASDYEVCRRCKRAIEKP